MFSALVFEPTSVSFTDQPTKPTITTANNASGTFICNYLYDCLLSNI